MAHAGDITVQAKALLIAYADLLSTAPDDAFLIDNEADFFAMDLELLKAVQPAPAPDRFVLYAAIGITRWYAENVLKQSLTELIKDSVKSTFAKAIYDAVRRYPQLP